MKLLDYIRGLRKGKEAHRLEKESMKDPFLADAMDGYHQVEGDHEQQIRQLRMRVNAHSAKKRNKYAITWSIAACLMIGIGISSYFLLLKQSIEDNVLEQVSSVSIQKMTPDSSHIPTEKEIVGKDIVAKTKEASKSREIPAAATPATIPAKASTTVPTPAPVMEEVITPAEVSEEVTVAMATDTSVSESDRKKMKITKLTAQANNIIRGKVTDENGEPLVGANICYKGTKIGTITDLNGEFSLIKMKGNEDLTINYIGYNRIDMQVDTSQTMLIAMNESDRQTLDEVVVVGYGTQKKRTVTGAVSTVSIEDLKKAPGILQNSDTSKESDTLKGSGNSQSSVAPKPVMGMKQYKKYLKKNLIHPTDEACAKVKGKVVLTFRVNKEGRPYFIRVKESLCKSLDKEAIRLILEGPDWTYGNKIAEVTVKF